MVAGLGLCVDLPDVLGTGTHEGESQPRLYAYTLTDFFHLIVLGPVDGYAFALLRLDPCLFFGVGQDHSVCNRWH